MAIFDVEQGSGRFLRQTARHFLVHEMQDLLLHGRLAGRCRWTPRLRRREGAQGPICKSLRLEAPVDHRFARQLDRFRIGRIQKQHRCSRTRIETLLAHAAQQIAHRHRHIAEIDVDRTRRHALVTYRAMVRHIAELIEMTNRNAAACLLFVQERLDQKRGRQDLVTRRIQEVRARHMRCADRLALAAAQTILDGTRDRIDIRVLHDQRLVPHQVEAGRVGVAQIAARHQLAFIEAAFRIDALLVLAEILRLRIGKEFQLRDADAMLA